MIPGLENLEEVNALCELQLLPGKVPGGYQRAEAELADDFQLTISHASSAPEHPVWVWRGRTDKTLFVGCGAAWRGTLAQAVELLPSLPEGALLYGARAFAIEASGISAGSDADVEDWHGFDSDCFVLPSIELSQIPGRRARIAFHFVKGGKPALNEAQSWISSAIPNPTSPLPQAIARWDSPNFEEWEASVRDALGAMSEGGLRKVVLARKSWLELAEPTDPFIFLEHLARRAPSCFLFAYRPLQRAMTFLGTSPELLYARKGAEIFSEALAATRSRSLDPSEDERLANQLFHSPKERAEHECVAQAIASYFASLCSSYERDREPSVLKLGRLQHLRTAFSGTLRDGTDDAQILSTLHPTPAVCGTPRDAAYARILACEPFTRGLYAGPLGVLSASKAEFCVAIRSMCIDGRLLNLYAGAGIVPGSDAEKEWWELDAKIEEITRLVS